MEENEQQGKSELDAWVQEQLKAHVAHLTKSGVVAGHMRATVAWVLPGQICLSRISSKDNSNFAYWVISGVVPTDYIERKLAATPRLAVRHFALKNQLQAARLDHKSAPDQTDLTMLSMDLERKAQALYQLSEQDEHWLS